VNTASSLTEAVAILKREPFRLAVVDLSLAGSDHHNYDGLKVLEAIHRLAPGCQTILLTGFATVELAVSVLTEYKAFTFLRKENFQRAQFHELIYRALAKPLPLAGEPLEDVPTGLLASSQDMAADKSETQGEALVVEDDAGWRGILSELLNDAGYQVRLCSSFGEALGYLRREKYSLAVMDLSLTGVQVSHPLNPASTATSLEGYQLLASTKANRIPTIVVSGIASPEDIQQAYAEQDIFAFLEKQAFDRNTFLRTVQEARLSRTPEPGGMEPAVLGSLTMREREVLALVTKGLTNKEISEQLFITNNTVKRHLKAIFEKLEVHTRSAAVSKASKAS